MQQKCTIIYHTVRLLDYSFVFVRTVHYDKKTRTIFQSSFIIPLPILVWTSLLVNPTSTTGTGTVPLHDVRNHHQQFWCKHLTSFMGVIRTGIELSHVGATSRPKIQTRLFRIRHLFASKIGDTGRHCFPFADSCAVDIINCK